MHKLKAILLISSTVLAACSGSAPGDPADIVLLNGGIYTVDTSRSWAEAAAVRDGMIVAVGNNDKVRPYIGAATELIDLEGRMAMPGIHDSHIHPLEGGYEDVFCNLWGIQGVDAIISKLQACESNNEGEWFEAVGLDLGSFGLSGPDKSILDSLSQDKYIFVDASDGHAALVNDKVLELVGIDENFVAPHDGVVERREGSLEPSGTVRETSRDLVDKVRPKRNLDTSLRAMRSALKKMNSFGITSVYDVWIGEHEMQVYKYLDDAGELSVRVLGGIVDEGIYEKHVGEDLERLLRDRGDYESRNISFNSIKMNIDGVFEGETAAILEPYLTTGDLGPLYREPDDLKARVKRYYDMGMQLHFHTMGDRAARETLNALEYARANGSDEHLALRHTLSHLGLINPDDMLRFAELNAGASVTMVWGFASEWTVKLEIPSLGLERVQRMYPIHSLGEAGGVVLGGSDWNYGDLDPLLSIETGITRDNPFGAASDGEYPVFDRESVDLATMIDAYTINGAWQLQAEDISGSIEAGKRADIVVYDRNLFDIDPYEISETQVDYTLFDGRIVYRRPAE